MLLSFATCIGVVVLTLLAIGILSIIWISAVGWIRETFFKDWQ